MSFILDALKKSETERQQATSTEFAAVPGRPAQASFPRWLLFLGILLAVNLVVLIGLLLRSDNQDSAAAPAPAKETVASELPLSTNSFEDQIAAAKLNAPAPREMPNVSQRPAEESQDVSADLISQNPGSVTAAQLYPTVQEMRLNGNIDIPDLHLDIHVYSEVPSERFVFINMTKLREGSRMEEGPTVEEITPNAVVLRHLGKSFLVLRD